MRHGAVLLLIFFTCLGCEEEFYPPKLYGSQVERLLTSGETKVWQLRTKYQDGDQVDPGACTDSLNLHFLELQEEISVYEINTCTPQDTVFWGFMTASTNKSGVNKNIFTDSLLFEDGTMNNVILRNINSREMTLQYQTGNVRIESRYESQ